MVTPPLEANSQTTAFPPSDICHLPTMSSLGPPQAAKVHNKAALITDRIRKERFTRTHLLFRAKSRNGASETSDMDGSEAGLAFAAKVAVRESGDERVNLLLLNAATIFGNPNMRVFSISPNLFRAKVASCVLRLDLSLWIAEIVQKPLMGYTRQLPHPFTYLVRRIPSDTRTGWPFAAISAATQ
jgi:hypothetical protein